MSTRRNVGARDPIAAKVVEFVELWSSFRHVVLATGDQQAGVAARPEHQLEDEIATAFASERKAA